MAVLLAIKNSSGGVKRVRACLKLDLVRRETSVY